MKSNKLVIALSLVVLLFTACKKEHYDVSNVHGVNAEGELLLPVASKSINMMDLMERFELTDKVEWSESGELSFGFNYEDVGVISGAEILKFKDLYYQGHYATENPYVTMPMPFVDTVHITQIRLAPKSDSFFPNLDEDPDWRCIETSPWLEEDGVPYRFCTYVRSTQKEEP